MYLVWFSIKAFEDGGCRNRPLLVGGGPPNKQMPDNLSWLSLHASRDLISIQRFLKPLDASTIEALREESKLTGRKLKRPEPRSIVYSYYNICISQRAALSYAKQSCKRYVPTLVSLKCMSLPVRFRCFHRWQAMCIVDRWRVRIRASNGGAPHASLDTHIVNRIKLIIGQLEITGEGIGRLWHGAWCYRHPWQQDTICEQY
jgi:hypothetical protein